jgi:hypothetical protein
MMAFFLENTSGHKINLVYHNDLSDLKNSNVNCHVSIGTIIYGDVKPLVSL